METKNFTERGIKNDDRGSVEEIGCACGCGRKLSRFIFYYNRFTKNWQKKERRFIHGHNAKFLKRDKDFRDKIRKSVKKWHKEVGHSEETIEKIRRTQLSKRDFYSKNKIGELNPMKKLEARLKVSKALRGENSLRWKGGITDLYHAIRKLFEYKKWHKEVRERDR